MHKRRIELREEVAAIDDVEELRKMVIESTEMVMALTAALQAMSGEHDRRARLSVSDAQLMLELAAEYDLDAEARIS